MIKIFQKNKDILLPLVLWLLVWGGYNTGIYIILEGNFFNSPFSIVHGVRAFLPILAGIISLVILVFKKELLSKNFLFTPIGCLLAFSFVGLFASIFSPSPLEALYWAFMYISVLLVLILSYFLYSPAALKKIIIVNWFIAGIILIGLLFSFMLQPGVAESLNPNSLICSQRPFEGLGGTRAEAETFGMAGSRPTGMARYAGIIAIIAFAGLASNERGKNIVFWFCVNIITLSLLLFTKGRAALLAGFFAMGYLLFGLRKIKLLALLLLILFGFMSYVSIFYKISCFNPEREKIDIFIASPSEEHPGAVDVENIIENNDKGEKDVHEELTERSDEREAFQEKENNLERVKISNLLTLSGRVNGVWKDALSLYLKSPLLGYGFHADRLLLNNQHVHNVLLHSLIQAGMVGIIIFILAFVLLAKMLYIFLFERVLEKRERVFLVTIGAVLIFILVRGITESFVYYSADWLFLAPIIAYVQFLYFNTKNKI